ncbi:MAG: hypothetical protein MMC33_001328 [Icmadophila ericetorum]|nr:hypothetical protein [Icmadophila ericetorum]
MHLQKPESSGPAPVDGPVQGPKKPYKEYIYKSSTLPFGQDISLENVAGPTYLTAQTLIQQVAYTLSDRLWTYSPETFDLDLSVKQWSKEKVYNAHGYVPGVQEMQVRLGAASIALGYMFSPDFDLKKRHIPQSILATSSSLQYLRSSLDQLSLLYSLANPLVAHVSAVDYAGASSTSLVTDYTSILALADELGLGVVVSSSVYESQHMAVFATLLAKVMPTVHLYDGIHIGRETARVVDVLDRSGLSKLYQKISDETLTVSKRQRNADVKVEKLLEAFNGELGTEYALFEYHGHSAPQSVLVVFGTTEASLASQVALSLQKGDAKIGVISVRVYRPFVEEAFLKALPKSVKTIGVLGQVQDRYSVSDSGVCSSLYGDVLAALTFSDSWSTPPNIIDVKYPREQRWTPVSIAAAFQLLVKGPILRSGNESVSLQVLDPATVQQYTFWDSDDSPSAGIPVVLGKALAKDSAGNVTVKSCHDNSLQGGVIRTDVRKSKKAIEASYSVESADVVYVGDSALLRDIDVIHGLKHEGKVIFRLPGINDDALEKALPPGFRKALCGKGASLYVLDTTAIDAVSSGDQQVEQYLIQLAFLRVAVPAAEQTGMQKLADINGNSEILENLAQNLDKALRQIEVPEEWSTVEPDVQIRKLPTDININSFVPFEKTKIEHPTILKNWQTAAKGLVFKEAFDTKPVLRPDLTVRTHTVHVKENRRLTPLTYDRNIFHIEFDLTGSDLTYEIGEALGIHAQNEEWKVNEFISLYGLEPEDVVEVPSREDPSVLENRTVYQALMQNVDLWGKPPKRFYESLAEFATNPKEKRDLLTLISPTGATMFKRRAEVDTVTYADMLLEFPSARPSFYDLVRIVSPMKRREYSIASCQKVTPTSVALMIVVVNWIDPKSRLRWGQATRYLKDLRPGTPVTVSVKPSVMKLPPESTQPLIMAGLGTGLAPFRAFVQHRAWEKEQGKEIGSVLLYMGSRHQREEYCYGEEWEAYQDAGIITLLGRAFSRDQPQKIYIQDRMRETMSEIIQAYCKEEGSFYLCGPTWPVPDVTNVLEDAVIKNGKMEGKKVDGRKEIEKLKDAGRFVLEVY